MTYQMTDAVTRWHHMIISDIFMTGSGIINRQECHRAYTGYQRFICANHVRISELTYVHVVMSGYQKDDALVR